MTLTQLQDETIRRMMESRSSARRHAKWRSAVLSNFYRPAAVRMGYTTEQVSGQVCDVRDMYALEILTQEKSQ